MENFDFYLKKASFRLQKKNKEDFFMKRVISKINIYVQKLKSENPNLTIVQLQDILDKDLEEIYETVSKTSFLYERCLDFQCCKFLIDNKDKFNSILTKIESSKQQDTDSKEDSSSNNNGEDNLDYKYTNDFEHNLCAYTRTLIDSVDEFTDSFYEPAFDDILSIINDPNKTDNEKNKLCNLFIQDIKPQFRKTFRKYIDVIKNGYQAYLKYDMEDIRQFLKDDLVDSLSSIGTVLDKYGFLEKYPEIQEKTNLKLGIPELNYSLDSSTPNNYGVKQLLSKQFLSSHDLETLLPLNIFWINRLAKELDSYAEGIFSCNQLDLFTQMLDGSFNFNDLDSNDLITIFNKMNILYFPTLEYLDYAEQNEDKVEKIKIENQNYCILDTKPLISYNLKTIGERYTDYFNNLEKPLPVNDLAKDLELFWKLYTPVISSYKNKDINILTALGLANIMKSSFNWGIVLTDKHPTILPYDNLSINLWMDVEGLNLPLRSHIPKMNLSAFLQETQGHQFIPIYKRAEDFDNIPTNLLLPFTKKQISFLKNEKKSDFNGYYPDVKNFLSHSASFINSKTFKKENPDTTYVNLEDCKFYKLDENNEFILLPGQDKEQEEIEKEIDFE